ncbi:MAG: DedA family protein [Acidobacteria bacterium]|nr:MAG: DedA family protein [Acidobacteriota bacterium]
MIGREALSSFNSLKEYLLALGIPGLFLITFLDSVGIPLVGGPDALILLLAWQKPGHWLLIGLSATMGSTLGCATLYGIGRKGGTLALSKVDPARRRRVRERLNRHALWTVMMAVIAPPPFPTKVFIVTAGVMEMRWDRFLLGVILGRFLRYASESYLGARYGDEASRLLKAHYPAISLLVILAIGAWMILRRLRRHSESINVETSPSSER